MRRRSPPNSHDISDLHQLLDGATRTHVCARLSWSVCPSAEETHAHVVTLPPPFFAAFEWLAVVSLVRGHSLSRDGRSGGRARVSHPLRGWLFLWPA